MDRSLTKALRRPHFLIRAGLIALGTVYLLLLIGLPLVAIFQEAFAKGVDFYLKALQEPEVRSAVLITLQSLLISVPLNTIFGVAAAWAITKFRFPFRNVLLTLIDLPFSVSPVIAGMVLILLLGSKGWFGPILEHYDIQIIFAKPGVILATIFVTLPFVVRELVPTMQAQGVGREEAAYSLGANGWQIFWRVTFPGIKWALLHGIILCQARAIGEYGAASVVSGHLKGKTVTLPLQIESLFSDYQAAASFACATLLTFTAFAAVLIKYWVERHETRTGV